MKNKPKLKTSKTISSNTEDVATPIKEAEGFVHRSGYMQVVGPSLVYADYPAGGTQEEIKKYFDDYYSEVSKLYATEYSSVWCEGGILNLLFKKGKVSYGVLFDKKKSKVETVVQEVEMFRQKSLAL